MPELKSVGRSNGTQDGVGSRSVDAEALSALMDDEAQELELRRVLRQNAPGTREHWYRLQVTRTVLQGETPLAGVDFAARVRAAIDAEPTQSAGSGGGWKHALSSFAVAASVTAVVVLGGQQLAQTTAQSDAGRVAPLPVGVVNTAGAVPVQASFGTRSLPTLQPADRTAYRELARQRLRRYSQEHAEHASLNTPQGMLPFARVPVIER
jgi:sigma-E factor negative regulatory protein RseA